MDKSVYYLNINISTLFLGKIENLGASNYAPREE